ncbi:spermidine/putrescine transport system permease protein [Halopelagius inordinatus]|uniref:Spermidine/putrescine transport system permease protein n=1 Tax=Halopelagius inordinatus TaxID=553467 RepID=A0A1I2S6S2_9EURY|nr:ABC transporter permease [Halopelagius inordinatus]SFG48595.1 spermidine/putrescine transport system permease protein [Halopelagius inordinatus]
MGSDTNTRFDVTRSTGTLFGRLRQNRWTGLIVNLAPSGFWLGVFFLAPLAVMFFYSFGQRGAFGEVLLGQEYLGLQQYRTFFVPGDATVPEAAWFTVAWLVETLVPFELSLAAQQPTPFVRLMFKSIGYGVVATLVSFLLGYPMAYYIGRLAPKEYQNLLVVLVIVPFWASFLVRIYAIQLLLASNSVLTTALGVLPFYEAGTPLMNSRFAVLLGLVYIWVPFMILPVYSSIEEVDFELQEAAMDLGADRFEAFYHVVFPLSKPGVAAGSILVFIPSAGAYVIPELLGGTDSQMIGNFIADQFGQAGNWPLGAAGAFVLMGVMLLSIAAYQRSGGELL